MNLEQKIKNYQTPAAAIKVVRQSKIALLVGISGAGKDAIKNSLLERSGFSPIVSHTTRAARTNSGKAEVDGQDYYFIDQATALKMIDNQEFIEVKFVHGTIYGTATAEVKKAATNAIALTDLDVQGVAEYRALSNQVTAIFVIPPSYNIWLERLRCRYKDPNEFAQEWPKRRASAIVELNKALSVPYYHCLINDDLAHASRVAADIAMRPDSFRREDDEARLIARDLLEEIKHS